MKKRERKRLMEEKEEREFKASGVLVCSLSKLSFPLHFELY